MVVSRSLCSTFAPEVVRQHRRVPLASKLRLWLRSQQWLPEAQNGHFQLGLVE